MWDVWDVYDGLGRESLSEVLIGRLGWMMLSIVVFYNVIREI